MRIRTVLLLSTLLGICISLSAQVPTSSQNYIQEVSPLVDDLSYTYNGNQLIKVEDSAVATAYAGGTDFRDNADTPAEYAYDASGNMTSDANKGITGITYNRLNLPEQITFSTGDVIRYVYGYDGTKLRVTHIPHAGSSTRTDYCGNITYENGTAIRAQFDGGYASLPDGNLHYYVKDHLGSNRLVVSSSGQIEERNDYYPYGGLFSDNSALQPYKYNGKELDGKFGLSLYDYGARLYNPETAHWWMVDPKTDEYSLFTPYNYCIRNPIKLVDPNGKEPTPAEAARIAAHVYHDSDVKLIGGWKVSKRDFGVDLNKNSSGLKSLVYERTKDGRTEYVYATAGTENFIDWKNNIQQLFGSSEQYKQSADIALYLSLEIGANNELNFVGHSLGGGEATLNSLKTYGTGKGRAAFIFNAVWITSKTAVKNRIKEEALRKAEINAFALASDPLTLFQNGINTSFHLRKTMDINTNIIIPHSISSVCNGHSINSIINEFNALDFH